MSDPFWTPTYRGHVERAAPPGRPAGAREAAREPRVGIMLHFDESASDRSGIGWFKDPRAWNVGYHYYILDDGSYYTMGPPGKSVEWAYNSRVYHAGRCRPSAVFRERAPYSDANSAFLAIATAARTGDDQNPIVELAAAVIARRIFDRERWDPLGAWRITGHEDEAWARGRKSDPTGKRPDGTPQVPPVFDKGTVRHLVPVVRPVEAA